MPASTSENNAPNSLPTSELTTASTNPSSTTPKRTMFIAGGILSTLLAGGLLFWQRKNIASLFGKSPKPAPSQADTFVSQVVEPVATATPHTPKGKAIGERVGAVASATKEKAGQAVSFLGNGVAMLPEVFGLLGEGVGFAKRGSVKALKWSINTPLDGIPSMFGRIMSLKGLQPKTLVKDMWEKFTIWRHKVD